MTTPDAALLVSRYLSCRPCLSLAGERAKLSCLMAMFSFEPPVVLLAALRAVGVRRIEVGYAANALRTRLWNERKRSCGKEWPQEEDVMKATKYEDRPYVKRVHRVLTEAT